ncbi:hypothetical protein LEP48_00835 [Isoptericola sp. NEAU-Y5]|uniref:Uncharacterized protein n=1 Tax=Isoptericola luteus TaxID=2879484 RepID=A0ABS7ZA10_9MICO|nr:hypothetical protein [Isoptericola sp. NEAU-Y5]MCA5891896.1 hypothetical protein [Isoptericola sp. NEAU-Y5]
MHTYVRRALRTALVTGGLVVAGAGMAHAAEGDVDRPVVDLTVGEDTSVDLNLSEVTEEASDAELDTPVDLPEVDTAPVEKVVDAAVGAEGVVDDVAGTDEPSGTTTDDLVDTVAQDVGDTVADVQAGDVEAVVADVVADDGIVDDAVEDGAADAVEDGAADAVADGAGAGEALDQTVEEVSDTVSETGAAVDDVAGSGTAVQDTLDGLVGEDGLVDDVVGADVPEDGVTDRAVEAALDDVEATVEALAAGDVDQVVDEVVAPEGLLDDVLEDQGVDAGVAQISQTSGSLDELLGTGTAVQDVADALVGADAPAGTDGLVDDVVGSDVPEDGVSDQVVEAVVEDLDGAADVLVAGDLQGVTDAVLDDGGVVDDLLEDQGLDSVLQDVADATGTEGLAGEEGLVDDVVGSDVPEDGVSDQVVEAVVEDLDGAADALVAGDLPGVSDGVLADSGLVDDVLENGDTAAPADPADPADPGDTTPGTTPGPDAGPGADAFVGSGPDAFVATGSDASAGSLTGTAATWETSAAGALAATGADLRLTWLALLLVLVGTPLVLRRRAREVVRSTS